jgi:hypothetical protein
LTSSFIENQSSFVRVSLGFSWGYQNVLSSSP